MTSTTTTSPGHALGWTARITEPRATSKDAAERRYREKLASFPAPGSGAYHRHLMGAAALGIIVGLHDADIFTDLRRATPKGSRTVSDREIQETIQNARKSTATDSRVLPARPRMPAPMPVDYAAIRESIITAGGGEVDPFGPDLWETSPIRLDWPREQDAAEFVGRMYGPAEFVWIGHPLAVGWDGSHCRTAGDWLREFTQAPPNPRLYTHLVPNPVTGKREPTKVDLAKTSYRALGALAAYRYAVAEFDRVDMPKPRQLAFWRGLALPNVAAVVDTGGKSLHVWLRVNATDEEHWTQTIKPLFGKLAMLGADRAGDTGGQLCRLPGVPRLEKGTRQQLLWLCPEGGRLQ